MGLGWKAFVPGEVLTAADTNGYLMDQGVMWFASATDRDTQIASPVQGMVCRISDGTEWMCTWDGTEWIRHDLEERLYTPSWTATVTNPIPNPGNGDYLQGWYRQLGKRWEGRIVLETNPSFVDDGSGKYFMSVPPGWPPLTHRNTVGTFLLRFYGALDNLQTYAGHTMTYDGTNLQAWLIDHGGDGSQALPTEWFATIPNIIAGQCWAQFDFVTIED